jgi:ribulose 1,5-bisphosphate synthetase/thiazole synthase
MKEGIKVKVIASITGHEFDIGEIVKRKYLHEDDEGCLGFYSKKNGEWYMSAEEYKVCDKQYAIDLAIDAANAMMEMGFSRGVWEGMFAAIDTAYEELGEI